MTKNWQCIHLFMIVLLVLSLPFGCCTDCDDDSPSDPGDGENTAPDTTIDSGPEGTVTSGDVSFTWSGSDPQDEPGDLTFSWILQPQETEWSTYDSSTMVDYTGLENGTYTFKVRARNTAGEVDATPAERVFTVNTDGGGEDDTTPPETQIVEGPDSTVNTPDVYFEWAGTDDTDSPDALVFSWRLDGGNWSTYAGDISTTFTGLADGTHTFEVRARDTAGNVDPSPASQTFDVDTTGGGDQEPPTVTITSGPSGTIDYTDVTFTYTGSDNVDPPSALVYSHRMDSGAWSGWSGSTTAQYNGLADGTHTFRVKARDTSGNEDLTPAMQSFTVETGGGQGVVIESGVKHVTGNPGEYVVIDVVVTSHQNATAAFRFRATSTPAHWENAYCVPGLCVAWDTVVTRDLDPGPNDCSVDFSIPPGEPSGTVSTIHWFVELVSDPSVSDDNVYTCTVN